METNIIDDRINRITGLLARIEEIPQEIDALHERLYHGFITAREFRELIQQRSNLILEQKVTRRKLREEYRVLEDEQSL